MRQLGNCNSHKIPAIKRSTLFISAALLLWLFSLASFLDEAPSITLEKLGILFDNIPLMPLGLLITGSSLTCCLLVLVALIIIRSKLTAYTLVYVFSSSCFAIILLLYPDATYQPALLSYITLLQLFRTFVIVGLSSTLPRHLSTKQQYALDSLQGIILIAVMGCCFTEYSRQLLNSHLYSFLSIVIALTIAVNVSSILNAQEKQISILTTFIALTHFAVISLFAGIFEPSDTEQVLSPTITNPLFVIWLDLIFIVLIACAINEAEAITNTNQKIKNAQQQQKLQDITGIVTSSRHELRAPLSDIIGLSELITDSPLDNRQRSYLMEIQQSAQKGLADINRLFSFHSLTHGSPDFETITFNIENILHDSIQYYALYLKEHDGEIVTDVSALNNSEFIGQPEKIRQLLINILEVILVRCAATQLLIKLTVNNNNNLLLEFESAIENRTANLALLNSLQLETAQQLAADLDGSINIKRSRKGLTATLPVKSSNQNGIGLNDSHQLKGKRALVLDDNDICCKVMTAYLQKMNIIAYSDNNAVNAVARLHHQSGLNEAIDLILVDYVMPNSDGLEVINHIFADKQIQPKPRCILMSNTPPDFSRETLINMGIDYVLEKPILANTLNQAIAQLTKAQPWRSNIPLNALIIEDNEISGKIISSQLEQSNFNCYVSLKAQDALTYLEHHSVDLVLMDYNLPDMHCSELTPLIQAALSRRNDHSTLVAMSADDSSYIAKECEQLGAHMFVAKPLNMEKINRILLKHEQHMQTIELS